jgi:hypothetical protein
VKEDINTLTSKDILLLGGGSYDLDKQIFRTALKLTAEFIKLHNPTNILLTGVPHCHDLHCHLYTNNEIRKYNRNLFKTA